MNLSSHSKEGTSLQFCILEKGSKHFCMSILGLGLDSMPKAKSCLVLTLRFTFTSEKILKGTLDGREREKENMNHSHDAFATWCTSTSHLCRQFGGSAILLECCGDTFTCSKPPPPSLHSCEERTEPPPSVPSPVWLQQEWCWAPSTGPWGSLLSLHPGSPFLHISDPLHSTSLPAWTFCAGQDSVPGARWAGHEPQAFCILSSAAGRISEWPCIQLSLPALCDPVRSSDCRSLCRAGMRLYHKD